MRYSILVIWPSGEQEYLKEGLRTAVFANQERAEFMRSFMLRGMGEDEVQSINVVQAPANEKNSAGA